MASAATALKSAEYTLQVPDDMTCGETFYLLRLLPEIRIKVWKAAMPDFGPCHFYLCIKKNPAGAALSLVPNDSTMKQRKRIAALSAVCREARHEIILQYPELLPLHGLRASMRFNYSSDVVMLDGLLLEPNGVPFGYSFLGHFTSRGIFFTRGWNAQVQNIAFKEADSLAYEDEIALFYRVRSALPLVKRDLEFLSLFPCIKSYFVHFSAMCDSGTYSAVRKKCQQVSVQAYAEQECASLEDIPMPEVAIDTPQNLQYYPPNRKDGATEFLRYNTEWKARLGSIMQQIVQSSEPNSKYRALVERLSGINYSAIIGFWMCPVSRTAVLALGRERRDAIFLEMDKQLARGKKPHS